MTLAELSARISELMSQGYRADTEIDVYLDNIRIFDGPIEEVTVIRPIVSEDIRPAYDGTIAIHVVTAEICYDGAEDQEDVRIRRRHTTEI